MYYLTNLTGVINSFGSRIGTGFRSLLMPFRQVGYSLQSLKHIRDLARPGRIQDVLMPPHHVLNGAWLGAAGTEKIDLKHQRVGAVVLGEQVLQGCVGDDAAVPEVVGTDLDHG